MIVNSNKMNFQDAVDKYLKEFVGETCEGLSVVIPQVAREAHKKLQQTSPKRSGGGEYAANWKVKTESKRMIVGATIYGGKPTYRLAHLLEYGHARRGGGRDVPPSPQGGHIEPVEKWAMDETANRFIDYMERNYS